MKKLYYYYTLHSSKIAAIFTWSFLRGKGSNQRANRRATRAKQIWLRAKFSMSDKIRKNGKVLVTSASIFGGGHGYR